MPRSRTGVATSKAVRALQVVANNNRLRSVHQALSLHLVMPRSS